jgi:hypothetical protein
MKGEYLIEKTPDGLWTVTDGDTGKFRKFRTYGAAVRWAEKDWVYFDDV